MLESLKATAQRISAKDRIDFYGFLATLIKGGYDIQGASGQVAKSLEQQADTVLLGKGQLLKTAKLYRYIEAEQRVGNPLHASLVGRVPDAEIMMLLAGSEGDILKGLSSAQESARRTSEMTSRIRKAVTYPTVLAVAVIFAMNWLGNNLLPTMEKLKPVDQWAPSEQRLHWLTTNIEVWVPIFVLTILAIIGATILVNMKVVGTVREQIAGVPPLNVIRKITATTFLNTLSSLVKAGSPFQKSLITMRNRTGSEYLRYYLDQAVNKMRSGVATEGPGRAIASKLFSPWVMVKLDIYSRSSTAEFTETMGEIAEDAQKEALSSLDALSRGLNLFLMISAAGTIGFTIITMFGIVQSIQSGAGLN